VFTPRKPMRYLTPAQRAVVCQAHAYVAEPGTRDVPDDVRETIQGARTSAEGGARAGTGPANESAVRPAHNPHAPGER
jgi:hypothetical protein